MAKTVLEVVMAADPRSLERGFKRGEKAADKFGTGVQKSTGRASKALQNVAKVGVLGVVGALGGAVKEAASFEKQMSSLGSISGATAKQMKEFRSQALKAGADTMYSAKEAAVAQTELAKGGLSVASIMGGGLKSALSLASAGELALGDAATYTANAMNLFGLKGKQSTHIADAFATAANATTADVSDFGAALVQSGSVAKSAGLSFDSTVVALEALASSGIKGTDAGTSLKTSLIQLLKPTAKQADLAKSLGLSFVDAHGKMKSLGDISGMLRTKLGDQTQAQRTATLATIAGTDGVRTLTALYDTGPKGIERFAQGLGKQGTAAEIAKKKQDNLAGSLEQLKGSMSTLGIQVGTYLIPVLNDGAKGITKLLNAMGSSSVPTKIFDAIKGAAGSAKTAVAGILEDFGKNRAGGAGIGSAIGKTFADAVGKINWSSIGSAVKKGVSGAFNVGGDVAKQVTQGIQAAMSQINGRDLLGGLLRVVNEAINALFSPSFWKDNFAAILATVTIVIPFAKILKIPGAATLFRFISKPFFAAVEMLGRGIISGLARFGGAAIDGFVSTLTRADGISGAGTRLISKFLRSVRDLPGHMLDIGKLAVKRAGDGIEAGAGEVGRVGANLVTTIANGVRSKLGDLKDFFLRLGKDIVGAIAAGIRSVPGKIGGAITGVAGGVAGGVKKFFGGKGDAIGRDAIRRSAVSTAPGTPSGALLGANSALAPFAQMGAADGLRVSSGKRATGGRTSSGGLSYHGSGEAIDMANGRGPDAAKMKFFRQMKSRYGSRLAELIYGPAGVGIKDGKPLNFGPALNAQHMDHVHVALDLGNPGPGIGGAASYKSGGKGDGFGRDIWSWAKGQGFTDAQAAGWVGNIRQESQGKAAVVQPNGEGHGLVQWGGGRFQALQAFAGKRKSKWTNKATQLAFITHELHGSERGAMGSIKGAHTVEDATYAIGKNYERYGDEGSRLAYAKAAFKAFGGKDISGTGSGAEKAVSPYLIKNSAISAALARAEGTSQTGDDISALGRQQGATGARIRKVQKSLKGNLKGATRVRLNDELSQLYGDRKTISTKIADLRKLDPKTGREIKQVNAFAATTDALALAVAKAAGTAGTKDDITAVSGQAFSTGQRISKVQKSLRRKTLNPETRQRLTQELTGLLGDRSTFGDKLTELRDAPGLMRQDAARRIAGTTETLTDDAKVAYEDQVRAYAKFADAQKKYGKNSAEAASAYADFAEASKTHAGVLEAQAQAARDAADAQRQLISSTRNTLAGLTDTLDDDLAAAYADSVDAWAAIGGAQNQFGASSAQAQAAFADWATTAKRYGDIQVEQAARLKEQYVQAQRDSISSLDADLVQAQVDTPNNTADDIAVVQAQLAQAISAYEDAKRRGDKDAIKEFGGDVQSLKSSLEGLQQATVDNTSAMADLAKAIVEQNALASSQVGVQNSQLVKALADMLSGQIVGVGLQGRTQTAGVGGTVSYGSGGY